MGAMRIVYVVVILLYVIGLWLIGLLWMLGLILPYLVAAGVIVYFIHAQVQRRTREKVDLKRKAERQRKLNAQELSAWQSAVDSQQRTVSRSAKMSRSLDSAREPRL